jgi:hypothetical protein
VNEPPSGGFLFAACDCDKAVVICRPSMKCGRQIRQAWIAGQQDGHGFEAPPRGAMRSNGGHDAASDGKFFSSGGHMEHHSVLDGLGSRDDAGLADAVNAQLGPSLRYLQQQGAGISTSAADYGEFLRRVVDGPLQMKARLGTQAFCTHPDTCATAALVEMPAPCCCR